MAEPGRLEAIGWGRALAERVQDARRTLVELRSPLANLGLAVIGVGVTRYPGRVCEFVWVSQIGFAGLGGDRDFFSLGHGDSGWWAIFVASSLCRFTSQILRPVTAIFSGSETVVGGSQHLGAYPIVLARPEYAQTAIVKECGNGFGGAVVDMVRATHKSGIV